MWWFCTSYKVRLKAVNAASTPDSYVDLLGVVTHNINIALKPKFSLFASRPLSYSYFAMEGNLQ